MDITEKKRRIESITNEVKELHPILENILPKLQGVKSYSYTHGQYERGADFIIEVESSSTKRTNHIGVVVKCGKISGAKVTEVEEQIKECAEERSYQVINRVRCSSVWVFASDGYSERAKEKLHERLKGRSIEFFGPEDIATFVDTHYPYFWSDLPIEIGNYLQNTKAKIEALDKSTGLLVSATQHDTYIELDTYEHQKKSYTNTNTSKPSTKTVDFIKEACNTTFGLLEAQMGFGKSKLARRLALSLCEAASYKRRKLLPILIAYRQFIDIHKSNLDDLIKITLNQIYENYKNGDFEVLIILDGIDECSSPGKTSTDLFEELRNSLANQKSCRVIVTSRPLKSLVDRAALYADTRTFGIRPLSLAKIVRYLEQTCSAKNLPSRLFEDLKRSPLFKQLPQSPIAAALFSNLLTQNQQEVPQSLTELYSKSLELMLGRWDQNKALTTEKQFKTTQLIAEQIACYYIENQLIFLSKDEFSKLIDDYLNKRNTGIESQQVQSILIDRSNVFISDDETGTIAFRHRSFAEFLCASKRAKDHSLKVSDTALNPYWINVFYFYVGTLLDCPEVLDELRKTVSNTETEEWMKLISVPSYLLAAYQTEFEVVENNLKVALLDAARLFARVKEGNTRTRLKDLSEMHLLYLFKSLVVESLGYDFFNRGFESIALQISDELEADEIKAHALFFLSCAALHCGNEACFKYMIDSYGASKLPITISLAIRCELESSTNLANNKLLKNHKDKLRKVLIGGGKKQNPTNRLETQGRLDDLFEKPLSTRFKGNISKNETEIKTNQRSKFSEKL